APPDLVREPLVDRWLPRDGRDPEVEFGPQPDAWLPESTLDARLVEDQARGSAVRDPVRTATSIGSSALVLGSMQQIQGMPTSAVTWPKAIDAVIGSGSGLLAPDRLSSTAGLFAMSTYLRGDSGLVGLSVARQREQIINAYGAVQRDDDLATICRFTSSRG